MTGPTENRGKRVNIVDTPVVPEGDSPEEELRAELRSARELLAVREAREGPREVMVVPPGEVAHPRIRGLSTPDLRDHIERLERDVRDTKTGRATLECLAEEAREDDDA